MGGNARPGKSCCEQQEFAAQQQELAAQQQELAARVYSERRHVAPGSSFFVPPPG